MKPLLAFTLLIFFPSLTAFCAEEDSGKLPFFPEKASGNELPGFTVLFDGKTLDGWEGSGEWFTVDDGAIAAGKLDTRIPRNEFLTSKKRFRNFELRLEVKQAKRTGNAGIQIRSERIPNHHEMKGYQADVGEGWWGKLYDESRRNRVLAGADAEKIASILKVENWNYYVIRCEGPRIRLYLNGYLTVDYTEPDAEIAKLDGLIGLQIHSGDPNVVWYRNLQIKQLKAD